MTANLTRVFAASDRLRKIIVRAFLAPFRRACFFWGDAIVTPVNGALDVAQKIGDVPVDVEKLR